MPNNIHGFKIGSSEYQYDYDYLANKPESIPVYDTGGEDSGKSLVVYDNGLEWQEVLPHVNLENNHNILAVVDSSYGPFDGGVEWVDPNGFIFPSYGSVSEDNNKVLGLIDSGHGYSDLAWVNILPAYDTVSQEGGKVLGLSDDNELFWQEILPQQEAEHKDLVLTADGSGNVSWDSVFPVWYSEDNGKVLMIVSSTGGPYENTDGVDWRYVLPPYDSSDAGKVLTIHDYSGQTEVAWEEIIPITYSHELYDRVLTIPAGSGGPQWRSIFPYYDSSDAGKVLSVNNDGELEWINP